MSNASAFLTGFMSQRAEQLEEDRERRDDLTEKLRKTAEAGLAQQQKLYDSQSKANSSMKGMLEAGDFAGAASVYLTSAGVPDADARKKFAGKEFTAEDLTEDSSLVQSMREAAAAFDAQSRPEMDWDAYENIQGTRATQWMGFEKALRDLAGIEDSGNFVGTPYKGVKPLYNKGSLEFTEKVEEENNWKAYSSKDFVKDGKMGYERGSMRVNSDGTVDYKDIEFMITGGDPSAPAPLRGSVRVDVTADDGSKFAEFYAKDPETGAPSGERPIAVIPMQGRVPVKSLSESDIRALVTQYTGAMKSDPDTQRREVLEDLVLDPSGKKLSEGGGAALFGVIVDDYRAGKGGRRHSVREASELAMQHMRNVYDMGLYKEDPEGGKHEYALKVFTPETARAQAEFMVEKFNKQQFNKEKLLSYLDTLTYFRLPRRGEENKGE